MGKMSEEVNCSQLPIANSTQNYSSVVITKPLCIAIFLIYGTICVTLGKMFAVVRKKVHRDKENLDIEFNAGGQVSIGLIATTLVSQWTWAATLLKSSDMCVELGLSGPFWYSAGACIQLILFSMLSVQLKIRAPGAKTFLQVIRARFGMKAHITFCVFALMTNVIVTAMLMLGGCAVLQTLVQDQSLELSLILICALVGGLTFSGGLGATFYVSYCTSSLMFIIIIVFMLSVFHIPSSNSNIFGNITKIYETLRCLPGPSGNSSNYLTMVSQSGLMFGIINIIGNFGTVFVDQSYWQNSVAAKPREGVWGFILGGLVWFAIPFTFSTTMGFAYLILNSQSSTPLLQLTQIQSGLVPPTVAQMIMGFNGELLIIILIILAVTSTASAEVMAVTSILIYDIYAIYLKPYRKTFNANTCLLCGKMRGRMANPRDKCICESMTFCESCLEDDTSRNSVKRSVKPPYSCKIHGKYRIFLDYLQHMKNWCIVLVTIGIIPMTLIADVVKINLGWLYSFMGVLIGSAVVPVSLTMFWARLTGNAAIIGSISGTICAFISWLAFAATFPGGLGLFFINTGRSEVMLLGNCVSIGIGSVVTIIWSFAQNRNLTDEKITEIWDNTRDIDNPLSPWPETYAKELKLTVAHCLDKRPSLEDVQKAFRCETIFAIAASLTLTFMIIILWPSVMIPLNILSFGNFKAWIYFMDIWAIVAAVFIITTPIFNEIFDIRTMMKANKVMDDLTHLNHHH